MSRKGYHLPCGWVSCEEVLLMLRTSYELDMNFVAHQQRKMELVTRYSCTGSDIQALAEFGERMALSKKHTKQVPLATNLKTVSFLE